MKKKMLKYVSAAIIIILIVNIFLLSLGKISVGAFWAVIAMAASVAYILLPRITADR